MYGYFICIVRKKGRQWNDEGSVKRKKGKRQRKGVRKDYFISIVGTKRS